MRGKAFVAHFFDATRATCNIIGGYGYRLTTFQAYPGYEGDLAVGGEAMLEFLDNDVTISLALTGIDDRCAASDCSAGNCCGVHIHAGTSCSLAELVGGHYFGTDSDPVTPIILLQSV